MGGYLTLLTINDKLGNLRDKKSITAPRMEDYMDRHQGPRTRITVCDEFGDVLLDYESNMVVLGGAITTLEKLFNVRSTLTVETINNLCHIPPEGDQDTEVLPHENIVCLWGVGIGGCGDAFGSVRDVKYYEREVGQKGTALTEMIPFRVVTAPFNDENANVYFMAKELTQGHYAYYGKAFDEPPFIRSLWKDGPEGEDGTEVTDDVWNTTRTESIETFAEIHMTIDRNDIREWFELNGEIEQARINTIGLFSATPIYSDGTIIGYKDVKLFSKFNMPNESMAAAKVLKIKYRIYVS